MKIMTNVQYKALAIAYDKLNEENRKLKEENRKLWIAYESVSRQLNECFRVLSNNNLNIDFPNSQKGEDSSIWES